MFELLALALAGGIIQKAIANQRATREARAINDRVTAARLYQNPAPRSVAPSTRPYLGPRRPRSLASRIAKHKR